MPLFGRLTKLFDFFISYLNSVVVDLWLSHWLVLLDKTTFAACTSVLCCTPDNPKKLPQSDKYALIVFIEVAKRYGELTT